MRILEHKGAVTSLRFLLPPAAMLDPEAWAPSRRLTVLQKGADETEPFACRLFSKTDKCGPQKADAGASGQELVGWSGDNQQAGTETGGDENTGLSVEELKQINHQLYQFALKNILADK